MRRERSSIDQTSLDADEVLVGAVKVQTSKPFGTHHHGYLTVVLKPSSSDGSLPLSHSCWTTYSMASNVLSGSSIVTLLGPSVGVV